MQARTSEKDKELRALQLRIERQQTDIEQLRNQYRTAQQNYDRQVPLQFKPGRGALPEGALQSVALSRLCGCNRWWSTPQQSTR